MLDYDQKRYISIVNIHVQKTSDFLNRSVTLKLIKRVFKITIRIDVYEIIYIMVYDAKH